MTFRARLARELVTAAVVGLPALGYVLATNGSGSTFVLLHAAFLGALAPLVVATLVHVTQPRRRISSQRARADARAVLRNVVVRLSALALAVALALVGIHLVTGIALSRLASAPLVVAVVPIFLGYALVALGGDWSELRAHAHALVASEARARQAALSARIRPHFLFNALNCIEELTDTDPPAARVAVGRLARLLRAVLDASSAPTATLASEARLVDDYFGIEHLRFGDRFSYSIELPPELAERAIPSTVLLTLAENAVKHGVEKTPGPAHVALVAARVSDGEPGILLAMTSPGALGAPSQRGYGLGDVRERLAIAYGDSATLALDDSKGGVRVELRLTDAA